MVVEVGEGRVRLSSESALQGFVVTEKAERRIVEGLLRVSARKL
jgi:hypothetical protein